MVQTYEHMLFLQRICFVLSARVRWLTAEYHFERLTISQEPAMCTRLDLELVMLTLLLHSGCWSLLSVLLGKLKSVPVLFRRKALKLFCIPASS